MTIRTCSATSRDCIFWRLSHWLIPIATIIALLTTCAAHADPMYSLVYDFAKGTVKEYDVDAVTGYAAIVGGKPVLLTASIYDDVYSRVKKVNADGSASMWCKSLLREQLVNRKWVASPPQFLQPQHTTFQLSASGTVTNLYPAIGAPGRGITQIGPTIPLYWTFPKDPVAVGNSWLEKVDLPDLGITVNLVMTLCSVRLEDGNECADVEGASSTFEPMKNSKACRIRPFSIVSAKGIASIAFDTTNGLIDVSELLLYVVLAPPPGTPNPNPPIAFMPSYACRDYYQP